MLLDVVEAMAGTAPTVIDLACGPGTITCRLLDRLPRAHSIAVDVDPVLLTIASATFADDDRVRVVRADLPRVGRWLAGVPGRRRTHGDRAALAPPGRCSPPLRRSRRLGPSGRRGGAQRTDAVGRPPRLGPALAEIAQQPAAGSEDRRARWDAWWGQASREPALQPAVTQRHAVFETTYPTEEFSPPADWHITALRDAGFEEAGIVWRSGPAAVVAAVR